MSTLYRNSRANRVRVLQIFFWVGTLGSLGLLLSEFVGAAPGSWVLGAILGSIFGLGALGMEIYLRCYVVALAERPEGVCIQVLSTLGRSQKIFAWSRVELGEGRRDIAVYPGAPAVNNGYSFLRIKGRGIPYIIDTTTDPISASKLLKRRLA